MAFIKHSIRNSMAVMMAGVVMMSVSPAPVQAAHPRSKKTSQSAAKNKKTSQSAKTGNGSRQGHNNKKTSGPASSAEAKRLRDAAEKDIRQTKEQIRLNEQEVKKGLSDLNRLSSEIEEGGRQVASLKGKVNSLQSEIVKVGDEITKNEAELARMRAEYLKAVKKMRLTQKNQSALAFVFASDNFNQAMRRIRYLKQFSDWKEKKSSDIDAQITRLDVERKKLADVKDMHASTLVKLGNSQKALESKHRRQKELVDGLRHNGDMLRTHLSQKQSEANSLNASISALIAREQAKAEAERRERERLAQEKAAREKAEAERREAAEREAAEKAAADRLAAEKSDADRKAAEKEEKRLAEQEKKAARQREKEEKKAAKKKAEEEKKRQKNSEKGSRRKSGRRSGSDSNLASSSPSQEPAPAPKEETQKYTPKTNFAALRGSLPRPVDGGWRITNHFGRHSMPELPEVVYDNPGIDAEVAKGTTVKAVCDGKVSGVYKVSGYGTVVIVSHGDYYTVYGNLASVSVSVGSRLGAGQKVGSAASDPDDPNRGSVHFEVWKGREKQNPESWLR